MVSHIGTWKSVSPGQAPRGTYFQVDHYEDACWYTKNHYAGSDLTGASASVSITTSFGNWIDKLTLNHLVFRIKRSAVSHYSVSVSFDLKMYLYSENLDCLASHDISEGMSNRWQLRCVDLSADGHQIYYTKEGTLFSFDHDLKLLNSWKIPPKPKPEHVRETAISGAIGEALLLFELPRNPNNEAIKTAYRKCLLKVHPDVNSQDPLATEKTREAIAAFELLTSQKYRDENLRYHNDIQNNFVGFQFPAFDDGISAIQTERRNGGLYVGCYSGKIYFLPTNGKFINIFDCQAPIHTIKELGKYIYILSRDSLNLLVDGKLVHRINGINGKLIWGKSAILEVTTRRLRIFSLQGVQLAGLEFRDNIADAYLQDNQVKVITANKIYMFSIGLNRLDDLGPLKSLS